ncbi:unnamed protein product, partial [Amoebophrya sp. A25]
GDLAPVQILASRALRQAIASQNTGVFTKGSVIEEETAPDGHAGVFFKQNIFIKDDEVGVPPLDLSHLRVMPLKLVHKRPEKPESEDLTAEVSALNRPPSRNEFGSDLTNERLERFMRGTTTTTGTTRQSRTAESRLSPLPTAGRVVHLGSATASARNQSVAISGLKHTTTKKGRRDQPLHEYLPGAEDVLGPFGQTRKPASAAKRLEESIASHISKELNRHPEAAVKILRKLLAEKGVMTAFGQDELDKNYSTLLEEQAQLHLHVQGETTKKSALGLITEDEEDEDQSNEMELGSESSRSRGSVLERTMLEASKKSKAQEGSPLEEDNSSADGENVNDSTLVVLGNANNRSTQEHIMLAGEEEDAENDASGESTAGAGQHRAGSKNSTRNSTTSLRKKSKSSSRTSAAQPNDYNPSNFVKSPSLIVEEEHVVRKSSTTKSPSLIVEGEPATRKSKKSERESAENSVRKSKKSERESVAALNARKSRTSTRTSLEDLRKQEQQEEVRYSDRTQTEKNSIRRSTRGSENRNSKISIPELTIISRKSSTNRQSNIDPAETRTSERRSGVA